MSPSERKEFNLSCPFFLLVVWDIDVMVGAPDLILHHEAEDHTRDGNQRAGRSRIPDESRKGHTSLGLHPCGFLLHECI